MSLNHKLHSYHYGLHAFELADRILTDELNYFRIGMCCKYQLTGLSSLNG